MRTKDQKKIDQKIVMLHGWGGSCKSFDLLGKALLEKSPTLKTYHPDFPGFGREKAPNSAWDTNDYANWMDTYLKAHNINPRKDKLVFYGHSFGCRVIIRWLRKHPEFEGKIILTGAAGIKWPLSFKQKCVSLAAKILKPFKKISRLLGNHKLKQKQTLGGKIYRKISRILGFGDWSEADEAIKPTLQKVLAEEDLRIYLPDIQNQTLLIWGQNDTYTPLKSAHVFAEKLPHNELVVFPDGRHGIHYTHTDQIAKLVVDFM